MARVPYDQGVPTVSPSGPPNDYLRIDAVPGAFGAIQAGRLQQVGQNLDRASENAAQVALLRQDRYNQIAVDDAFNGLQDSYYNLTYGTDPASPGIYSLKGRAALDKGPDIIDAIKQARQSSYDGLQNDAQKLAFDVASRRMQSITLSEVGRHLDQQTEVYGQSVNEAMIDNAARTGGVNWNNEDTFASAVDQANRGAARLAATRGNANDPEITRSLRDTALSKVISSRADQWSVYDPAAALNWVQNGKMPDGSPVLDSLNGPAAMQLQDRLQSRAERGNAAADADYIHGLMNGGGGSNTGPISNQALPQEAKAFLPALSGGEGNYGSPAPKGDRSGNPIPNNRYQFLRATWETEAPKAGVDVNDFRPASQDAVAWNYSKEAYGLFTGGRGLQSDLRQGGHEAQITQALNKIWPSLPGGSEQNTSMSQFLGRLGQSASRGAPQQSSFPDESAVIQKIQSDFPNDPVRQHKLISEAASQFTDLRRSQQTQHDDLVGSLPNVELSLMDGQPTRIPEPEIRQLLPPAQAAKWLEQLDVAQTAGQAFNTIRWGSPAEIQSTWNDLSQGMGPLSTTIRNRVTRASLEPGVPPQTEGEMGSEAYGLRQRVLQRFEQQVQTRNASLIGPQADPAAYVSSNPTVMAKAAAVDPSNPATIRDLWKTSLSIQGQLGVPKGEQHILTRAAATADAQKFLTADPQADAGQTLADMSRSYGEFWPQAFADMRNLGGLPENYQTLAQIPGKADRWDFQQMLQAGNKSGNLKPVTDLAGEANVKQINQAMVDGDNDLLHQFRKTTLVPGVYANLQATKVIEDGVRNLAAYYVLQGVTSPTRAVDRASQAIIGNKYDFDNTTRVPKGMLPAVQTASSALLDQLRPADLAPMAADTQATEEGPGLSESDRQQITLEAARKGNWIANQDESGLLLVGQDRDGRMHLIRKADGDPVELKFRDVGRAASAPQPAGGMPLVPPVAMP
jgi:hypothetical protein